MFSDQGRPDSCRRQFLVTVGRIASSSLCLSVGFAAGGSNIAAGASGAEQAEPVTLHPANQGIYRVRVDLEIEGNVSVPKDPLVSRKEDLKLPIRSTAAFDYEERYRRHPASQSAHASGAANGPGYVTMLERYYHAAKSTSELNRRAQTTSLRESVRSTIVRRELLPEVVYSVDDYFERDELELLRTPVSSVALDELLPAKAVRAGDEYSPSADVMMSVLNLSAVQSTDVVAKVVSITPSEARVQFRGDVQGSVDGVPTTVRVAGKLTFHRQLATCTWMAMAIHETREAGRAEPGFDIAGTIKIVRKKIDEPIGLPTKNPSLDTTAPIPDGRLYVDIHSDELGIRALMNRDWRMMTDVPGTAMMRMIDNDQSVAQCDFRPLASLKEGEQWTLEALQTEVKRTLGEQLIELAGADQQLSGSGLRVMRVTANGAAENIPIRWVVLHFSDDSGRRMLATFTMEGDHVEAFAGADDQLVSSLRMVDPTEQTVSDLTSSHQQLSTIAKEPTEVESASDFR